MTYTPRPVDTSQVALTDELLMLIEQLAENAHEIWSQLRIKDGWQLGPERNDHLKTNPCLVPYGELPDSEKEYDRQMVRATVKAIRALGYEIGKEG